MKTDLIAFAHHLLDAFFEPSRFRLFKGDKIQKFSRNF